MTARPETGEHPTTDPPLVSVMRGGRLVAYVWAAPTGGVLRRAGRATEDIALVGCATILMFDPSHEATLATIATGCDDIDRLQFRLGVAGYDLVPGAAQPSPRVRRF